MCTYEMGPVSTRSQKVVIARFSRQQIQSTKELLKYYNCNPHSVNLGVNDTRQPNPGWLLPEMHQMLDCPWGWLAHRSPYINSIFHVASFIGRREVIWKNFVECFVFEQDLCGWRVDQVIDCRVFPSIDQEPNQFIDQSINGLNCFSTSN